jgi:hypothetical protein
MAGGLSRGADLKILGTPASCRERTNARVTSNVASVSRSRWCGASRPDSASWPGFGFYRNLIGHIDTCSPADLLDGTGRRRVVGE